MTLSEANRNRYDGSAIRDFEIMEPRDSSPLPSDGTRSSFPQNPEEFDADPRVSFSKIENKFILETDDGQEFEFDDALKRWVPVVRPARSILTGWSSP